MDSVRTPRALVVVCAGLALAAALLWGASAVNGVPALTGVALLALAGVAGVVATAGVLRRLVGALLAAAGVVQAGFGVGAGAPLAVAGGLMLLAAGGLVALREPQLLRFGSRYAAPRDRLVPRDPDRAAWEALDAGADPTADPVEGAPDGTDGGHRKGRG